MQKIKYIAGFFISIFLLLNLSACAEWHTDKTIGQNANDTALATKVRTALLADPKIAFKDLDVHVENGQVQLSGFVNTSEQAQQAVYRASRVKGVKTVYNHLIVRHLKISPRKQ